MTISWPPALFFLIATFAVDPAVSQTTDTAKKGGGTSWLWTRAHNMPKRFLSPWLCGAGRNRGSAGRRKSILCLG